MNDEKHIIKLLAQHLPRCKDQLNKLFESDSEIVPFPSSRMLFSIDEFSAEDHFREDDPFLLGWNLAIATISNIYASGGIPLYYAHSIVIEKGTWNNDYYEEISKGIAAVLRETNTSFIGGDFGIAQQWHYTGVVIGTAENPIMRTGTKPGEIICMTGKAGAGNIEAALKHFHSQRSIQEIRNNYKMSFIPRVKESVLINQYATTCIDSSDGIVYALLTIADLNQVGFKLNEPSYIQEGETLCNKLSIPRVLLLLGECGEYELIFTIKEGDLSKFEKEAEQMNLSFSAIGQITESPQKILITPGYQIDLTELNIKGKDFDNVDDYVSALTYYMKTHGAEG